MGHFLDVYAPPYLGTKRTQRQTDRQRKKQKLSRWQTLMRKKFPDTKSGNFPECLQTLKSVHKLSEFFKTFLSVKVSTNFSECMETFQRVRKHSIVPENFPECSIFFLQRSGSFSGCTEIFQDVQKRSKQI